MNNEELEKYLNSLILCIEYYFRYELFVYLLKKTKTSNVSFVKEIEIYDTVFYSAPKNELDFIKNHLERISVSEKAIEYFIYNLQNILDEYIIKNGLDFIEVNYVVGTNPLVDGLGNILIQTETETFLLAIRAD